MAKPAEVSPTLTVTLRRWMSVREVSEYLGVSPRTVWSWLDSGVLTRRRISGTVRVDRHEVDRILAEGEK